MHADWKNISIDPGETGYKVVVFHPGRPATVYYCTTWSEVVNVCSNVAYQGTLQFPEQEAQG